jgi:hypothetical protein
VSVNLIGRSLLRHSWRTSCVCSTSMSITCGSAHTLLKCWHYTSVQEVKSMHGSITLLDGSN